MAIINGSNSTLYADRDYITSYYYDTSGSDVINLFAGDDYALGGLGADTIYGGDGWDYLYGEDDIDVLFGGFGDDLLDGGLAADTLYGDYGDDDLSGGSGADSLFGGYGADFMAGNAGSDTIRGQWGNDVIFGDGPSYDSDPSVDGADELYGGEGYDQITGGAGGDTMDGGSGDDVLDAGSGSDMVGDKVFGGAGIDLLRVSYHLRPSALSFQAQHYQLTLNAPGGFTLKGVERYEIRGTNFDDQITGWEMDDDLRGGKGDDKLKGLGGEDSLWGGYAADTLHGGNGDDDLYGDDTGYSDWNEGTAPSGSDLIYGGWGNDYAEGGDMGDSIYGESGRDILSGENGNDLLDGGTGGDDLRGGDGSDEIKGGDGDDHLYSVNWTNEDDGGRDVISAGAGSDFVSAGVNDKAVGGTFTGTVDTIHLAFGASGTGINYNLSTNGQTLTTLANGAEVGGFEALTFYGGTGYDTVTGAGRTDVLYGGKGRDTLNGHGGNDVLDGNDGADTIDGGDGRDTLYDGDTADGSSPDILNGGAGNDTISDGRGADTLNGGADDDTIKLGTYSSAEDFGADKINGSSGYDFADYYSATLSVYLDLAAQGTNAGAALNDQLSSIEHVRGSVFDDFLLGDGNDNWFEGGARDDVLKGRGGADWLDGGAGADELQGGAGSDTFALERDDGYLDHPTYWPHDQITDFNKADDELAILKSEFGVDELSFKLVNNSTSATSSLSGRTFIFEQDAHRLWFDQDGKGQDHDPVLIATLDGINSLSKSDFGFYDF